MPEHVCLYRDKIHEIGDKMTVVHAYVITRIDREEQSEKRWRRIAVGSGVVVAVVAVIALLI